LAAANVERVLRPRCRKGGRKRENRKGKIEIWKSEEPGSKNRMVR
jgi:hypothetical protein